MAELSVSIDITNLKSFKKLLEQSYTEGYLSCAEEHGHLDSIDSDINIAGIGLSEDDE